MNYRRIALLLAAGAALAPAVSSASSEKDAINACAHAFASSLASPGSAAPGFKVVFRGNRYSGSMLEFYNRAYVFDLLANDPKTGLPYARATCATDARGAVVALSPVPLDAAPAALAAKL
ncbi:MAG: hypothetical protein WBF89_09705 [Steroidobacteraceae bacterium]